MNKKNIKGWLKHGDFILIDIILMQLAYIIAYWMHEDFDNPYDSERYIFMAVVIGFCQLVIILFSQNYKSILRRSVFEELLAVCRYMGEVIVAALLFIFVIHRYEVTSRLQFGLTSVVFILLSFLARCLRKFWLFKNRESKAENRSIILITSYSLVQEALDGLTASDLYVDFKVTGVVLLDEPNENMEREAMELEASLDIPVLPLNDEAITEMGHGWVDEVFILQPENLPFPRQIMDDFMEMGITVNYSVPAINDDKWPVADMRKLGRFRVLTNSIKFISAGDMMLKRIMDIAGGIVGCLMTGVIFIFVAPIIYIKSPGPIFFKQQRVGLNGKTFMMYKFRSMYMDAEERKAALMAQNKIGDGMMFKMDDDPRIIGSEKKDKKGRPAGIGNFIRRTSLDEFPQFINVLKGDMSLVGTRPPTMDEWQKYDMSHRVRMSIKPGITGMWQVSGRSSITDFNEVVRLDREYIENWRLSLDIKILLKTVWVVIMRSGAS
ncbi:MAG: sugar transferase [Lachnospiraceae bacterium]|nr:sugar transferase [Lachnospiraceae bacterium]